MISSNYKITLIMLITILNGYAIGQDNEIIKSAEKRAGLAAAEVIGNNILVWSYDRYLREDNYSFLIGWRTVETNFRKGFIWDPNNFGTNFFAHPYHGSLYFNAARTNGFNYWESIPFVFAGSMMWEIGMESEFPSFNDLIATTFGGISLGEVLFRFSEQILDDRSSGLERAGREFAGAVVNPIGALNRLINGNMFYHSTEVNHIRNRIKGYAASAGPGRVSGTDIGVTEFSPAIEMTINYGEPLNNIKNRKPFDHFTFRFWTSKRDSGRNLTILTRAVLAGKSVGAESGKNHLLGVYQYYDFFDQETFKIGALSYGMAFLSQFNLPGRIKLSIQPAVAGILLGAGSNEYVNSYQGRNYNYGQGVKGKLDLSLEHPRFGLIYADYNYFALNTLDGEPGLDILHVFYANYLIKIIWRIGLGLEYFYYHRDASYLNNPDVVKLIRGLRVLVTYHF